MNRLSGILALTTALLPAASYAAPDQELVNLINAYRANPPPCGGARPKPLPPLAPEPVLSRLKTTEQGRLLQAMKAAGYRAARAEALRMSGPADAQAALRFAVQHHCRLLLSRSYSAIGVSRQGQNWQIVLAQPLLHPDLGGWLQAGQEVLKLVNAARKTPRRCGDRQYGAAPPLRWNTKLASAALKHSQEMARHNYVAHEGRDGSTAGARTTREGYAWRSVGENVAAGQGSARQVVDAWLASPGHCSNVMGRDYTEMGAAYALDQNSDAGIYWTQVFASPR